MEVVTEIPAAPPRPTDGHKGTFGTVMVVGGSATMIGAPALCASAALRAGVGLVKIAAPGRVPEAGRDRSMGASTRPRSRLRKRDRKT